MKPQFSLHELIPAEMLAYATEYEAQIFQDMELRRKQMLCAKFEPVEHATRTGIYLRVVVGGVK